MTMQSKQGTSSNLLLEHLKNVSLWLFISIISGLLIGSAAALFLFGLDIATNTRIAHSYLLFGLPFAGLLIGYIYHNFGGSISKGNNLLLEEYNAPSSSLPLKMAPLILVSTWITHLFGGSAGREGTAIQIGATLSDQLTNLFPKLLKDRRRLLLIGMSAGFAAVFGTPIAGFLFSLEIVNDRIKIKPSTLFLVLIAAYTAHFSCLFWGIEHTAYPIVNAPDWSILLFLKISIAGILFGLAAKLFIHLTNYFNTLLTKHIHYPPLVPFFGAILFITLYYLIGDDRFLGLGIPTLLKSFEISQSPVVFLLKILFTAVTIGSGFKGGEVTPLFFIGATLGSMLSIYLNLPISFLASLGFIAVFSGATKTPITCAFMGLELFGYTAFVYFLVTTTIAYLISGSNSIYKSQNHTPIWKLFLAKKKNSTSAKQL